MYMLASNAITKLIIPLLSSQLSQREEVDAPLLCAGRDLSTASVATPKRPNQTPSTANNPPTMADEAAEAAEKEARRKKHRKRMNKILVRAWNLPEATPFQDTSHPSEDEVRDLSTIGRRLDKGIYEHGRSGWEIFAKDMGLVYNWHITR